MAARDNSDAVLSISQATIEAAAMATGQSPARMELVLPAGYRIQMCNGRPYLVLSHQGSVVSCLHPSAALN